MHVKTDQRLSDAPLKWGTEKCISELHGSKFRTNSVAKIATVMRTFFFS